MLGGARVMGDFSSRVRQSGQQFINSGALLEGVRAAPGKSTQNKVAWQSLSRALPAGVVPNDGLEIFV